MKKISKHNQSPIYLEPDEIDRILSIKILLEQNLDEHITTSQLAKKALMNEFKLKKGFRQLVGTSLFDYHFHARMTKAKSLLLETTLSIEEIAMQTGYRYLSSFISSFKKLYNITPAAFKRMNRQ